MFGGGFGSGGFGSSTPATTASSLFGNTTQTTSQATPLFSGFGTTTTAAPATGFSAFGTQPAAPGSFSFGAPASTASSSSAPTASNAFGGFGIAQPSQPSTFGGFGTPAATQPTAAAPSLGFSAFSVSSQPASVAPFSFGTAAVTTTAPSGFGGFGGFATPSTAVSTLPTATSAAPSLFGSSQPANTAPGAASVGAFSFGQASSQPAGNISFGGFTAKDEPASSSAPAPLFGLPAASSLSFPGFGQSTQPATSTATSAAPSFGFTAPAPMQTSSFAAPAAPTAAPLFSFNSAPSGASSTQPAVASAAPAPANFSFGVTQPAQPATTAPAFSFGGALGTTPSAPGSVPNTGTATSAPQPTFSFGTATPTALPAQPTLTLPAPQTASNSQPSIFSRLGSAPATTIIAPATGPTSTFSFGNTTSSAAAVPAATATFSFSTPATSAAASISTESTFKFGLPSSTAPATTQSGPLNLAFGQPSATMSSSAQPGATQPTASVPGFAFLTPQQAQNTSVPATSTTNVPATAPAPSSTGFSFGASLSSVPTNTTAVTQASEPKLAETSAAPAAPASTAATTLVFTTLGSTTTAVQASSTASTAPSTTTSTASSTAPSTSQTAPSQPAPQSSGVSEEDQKLLDRFKKMTYDDFEAYLEESKKAVDQLEENWIQSTIKLNAFLTLRKDNSKTMRVLRNKIEEIWDFEAKVERNLAVVSLSMNEIEETLTYLEKNATDPDDFFRKNTRRISPEDRYRANCYKTLDMLYREVRIGLADIDSSRKKLLKNLIKEDEVRDLLLKNQMLSGQFEPKLLIENPHILGTISSMLLKDVKEIKSGQRQALTKLRFQKAQVDAQAR